MVSHGNKFDKNKMQPCLRSRDSIAFVGRSAEKNGVVAHVERLPFVEPYESGVITVALGGSSLSSFVQPDPFYTAQNIDVLRPREEMSLETKLYYCLCIESNRFRYSTFGREANRTLKFLLLPDRDSVPEWVSGITSTAIAELGRDLTRALR